MSKPEPEAQKRGMPIPDSVVIYHIRRLSERGAKLMLYNLLTFFSGKERRNYGMWTRVLHILEFFGLDVLDHPTDVVNPYFGIEGMFNEESDGTKKK